MTLENPTTVTFGLFLAALCAESWCSWRYLTALRRNHPELWQRCGAPTIWSDGDLLSCWPTVRFLWRREYVCDAEYAEISFCERHRLPVVLTWVAAWALVIAFFGSLLAFGW